MSQERETVLVVDDEETVRELLQRVLKEAGFDAVTAANGQEALEKISQLKVGAVFLDIKMPGMSGIEVLQQLSANWPEICVIMATAVVDTQTAVDVMKLGAYDYITKPFSRDDVVLKLRRAFEKRSLLLQNEHHRLELERRVGEQAESLQQQFVELVDTLSREHRLIYKLAYRDPKHAKEVMSKHPLELREPMASVEEFSEALLRVLRRGALKSSPRTSAGSDKSSKQ